MKILWLYGSKDKWDEINHWYHMDFVRILKQQPGIELFAYGYNLSHVWCDLAPIKYNSTITGNDIKKIFNYDVIIMDNKGRFFNRNTNNSCWLKPDFFNIENTPKIMLEGDYHQHHKNNAIEWYKQFNIDLMLQRHLTNIEIAKNDLNIKQLWFPCSVDINIFNTELNLERKNKICFIGGWAKNYYPYRNIAGNILKKEELADVYTSRLIGENYIKNLQSYISHLNCSSCFHIDTAKMFEIMASGSALLTDAPDDYGLAELFDKNTYYTYKRDGSDVISQAKHIINDKDYRKFITTNAIECIKRKHNHVIRAQELIKIIKTQFNISDSTFLSWKEYLIEKMCTHSEVENIKKYKLIQETKTVLSISKEIKTEEPIKQTEGVIPEPLQVSNSIIDILNLLKTSSVDFWLLGVSCLEIGFRKEIKTDSLYIGVGSSDDKSQLENSITDTRLHIQVESDRKTKTIYFNELSLKVPCPITKYLIKKYKKSLKDLKNGK